MQLEMHRFEEYADQGRSCESSNVCRCEGSQQIATSVVTLQYMQLKGDARYDMRHDTACGTSFNQIQSTYMYR